MVRECSLFESGGAEIQWGGQKSFDDIMRGGQKSFQTPIGGGQKSLRLISSKYYALFDANSTSAIFNSALYNFFY